jgi:hypothetical protein
MKSLPHGLYEQLINTHLEEKLRQQGITISKDALKNFDSPVLQRFFQGATVRPGVQQDSEFFAIVCVLRDCSVYEP